jgi:ADP-ribosylglycohydrolase
MRTFPDAAMIERAQGCWLGQLAGDSLGSLVEFLSPDLIRAFCPQGVRDLEDGGVWDTQAGQPTDDSELALMLARSLLQEKRFDSQAVFSAYVHWYHTRPFDVGGTIFAALAGGTPRTASQANGSLMRISPLGIFGARCPEQAAEWARADSRLTHPNPICQDSCAVFVSALATAIGSGASAQACHEAALAECRQPEVRTALETARDSAPADYLTQQGWVLIAVQNAFYQLLHAPSLEQGVIDTVMRGGDTDTTAAIAGALLGSVHGRAAIPERWSAAILSCRPEPGSKRTRHPRPPEFWPNDAHELAESLLRAGPEGTG